MSPEAKEEVLNGVACQESTQTEGVTLKAKKTEAEPTRCHAVLDQARSFVSRRVLSQVSLAASAASASVIPISGYFGSQKRQAIEINARRVICPKHARGAHGSRDYARHQEAASKALPFPFALAKHFHAKNAEGEASNKYANLQSKYAGNLAKMKTLKRRMDAWVMISPFVIPEFVDPFALSVEDRWGDRKLTGVNLLKNWGKVTPKQC